MHVLDLGNNSMTAEGATALAAFMERHREVKDLNLYMNDIGSAGLQKVGQTLVSQGAKRFPCSSTLMKLLICTAAMRAQLSLDSRAQTGFPPTTRRAGAERKSAPAALLVWIRDAPCQLLSKTPRSLLSDCNAEVWSSFGHVRRLPRR